MTLASAVVSTQSQKAKFIRPTWGPPGSCRPQMGPILAPWTLLSRMSSPALQCSRPAVSAYWSSILGNLGNGWVSKFSTSSLHFCYSLFKQFYSLKHKLLSVDIIPNASKQLHNNIKVICVADKRNFIFNKANLCDLTAVTGLVMLSSLFDHDVWWMTLKDNK